MGCLTTLSRGGPRFPRRHSVRSTVSGRERAVWDQPNEVGRAYGLRTTLLTLLLMALLPRPSISRSDRS
jgi:hypothetical protein